MSPGNTPPNKVTAGRRGEDRAVSHLQSVGMRVIKRNHRTKLGEIDLIALDGDVLVFVEVRTRASARYGSALATVGARKQNQIAKVAGSYLSRRAIPKGGVRFDVVGITGETLTHIKDAFRLGEFSRRW